jgi:hypothetical protein
MEPSGGSHERSRRASGTAEVRDLATYDADLREAVAAEYRDRQETRPDRRQGRRLDPETADAAVDRGCERIRDIEERVLSPAMCRIEADDPDRVLVGFEHRLKGPERIKEKVGRAMLDKGVTAEQALADIPDAVRYTFGYPEARYAAGVQADTLRLQGEGYELVKMRNTWASDQYRGINSQWREPHSGQRFEVQFHTAGSFHTKELTHHAYELLRSPGTSDEQARELRRFQRETTRRVPIPPGAEQILDFPKGA